MIYDDFGGAKDFFAAAVTALIGFDYGLIGVRRILASSDRFMAARIETLAGAFFGFDAMAAEKLMELLESHLHAFTELLW